jgi:Tfp pilus assembly protein PilE
MVDTTNATISNQSNSSSRRPIRGFAVAELLIVVVALFILSGLLYVKYAQFALRFRAMEAFSAMTEYHATLEKAYVNSGSYSVSSSDSTCLGAPPMQLNFTFTCDTSSGGSAFVLTATGKNRMAGLVYTIDQQKYKRTIAFPAAWGWSKPVDRWVVSVPSARDTGVNDREAR